MREKAIERGVGKRERQRILENIEVGKERREEQRERHME